MGSTAPAAQPTADALQARLAAPAAKPMSARMMDVGTELKVNSTAVMDSDTLDELVAFLASPANARALQAAAAANDTLADVLDAPPFNRTERCTDALRGNVSAEVGGRAGVECQPHRAAYRCWAAPHYACCLCFSPSSLPASPGHKLLLRRRATLATLRCAAAPLADGRTGVTAGGSNALPAAVRRCPGAPRPAPPWLRIPPHLVRPPDWPLQLCRNGRCLRQRSLLRQHSNCWQGLWRGQGALPRCPNNA